MKTYTDITELEMHVIEQETTRKINEEARIENEKRRNSSFDEAITQAVLESSIKYHDPIEWDVDTNYKRGYIVFKDGRSYLSKKDVPAGVAVTNGDYWQLVNDGNAEVEKLSGYIDDLMVFVTPEMFGAVGDGSTDDHMALKKCFDAKLPVVMKRGARYFTSKGVCIYSDVYGNGASLMADTINQPAENPQSNVIAVAYIMGQNIDIRNLSVLRTGNWDNYWNGEKVGSSSSSFGGICISLNAKNITIMNCHVDTPREGIICYSADAGDISIVNCSVVSGIAYQFEIPDTGLVDITEPKSISIDSCYGKGNVILAYGQNRGFSVNACFFENFEKTVQPGIRSVINDAKSGYYVNSSVFNGCTFKVNSTQSTANSLISPSPFNSVSGIEGEIRMLFNSCSFINSFERRNGQPLIANVSSGIELHNCKISNGYIQNTKKYSSPCKLTMIGCSYTMQSPKVYAIAGDDDATIINCDFKITDPEAPIGFIKISGLVQACKFEGTTRTPIFAENKTVVAIGNRTDYTEIANLGVGQYDYHGLQNISNGTYDAKDGIQLLPPVSFPSEASRLTPKKGDIVYDKNNNNLAFWTGTEWKTIATS